MAIYKFFVLAFRDLWRNRRRTILTLVAVSLGLALVIVMNGYVSGVVDGVLRNSIEFQTGHLQVRSESYEEEKLSLLSRDLLDNPGPLASKINSMTRVKDASPVLWSSGVLSTILETTGIRVTGIDPNSSIHNPFRNGMVAGEFLTGDDRGGILIGARLAESLGIGVGQKVSLVVASSGERPKEGIFTIRGLFATGIPSYDDNTVLMSLTQAQAVSDTGERASAIVIMLEDQDEAGSVAAALKQPGISTLTWKDLNSVLLESVASGLGFYYLMYGIVILVVAVIIANTLLMAVFERIREMGIFAALGMKNRQVLLLFELEASILAFIGISIGIMLGSAVVLYLAAVGIPVGDIGASAGDLALGTTLYTKFVPGNILYLSAWTFLIILLVSLYPASFASRLEPVKALHAV